MDFKKILADSKYVIGTIFVIISSLVGAYQLATEYFVTKAYAEKLFAEAQQERQDNKILIKQNTLFINEIQLQKFEKKIESGSKLSPSEDRQYKMIIKRTEELYQELSK